MGHDQGIVTQILNASRVLDWTAYLTSPRLGKKGDVPTIGAHSGMQRPSSPSAETAGWGSIRRPLTRYSGLIATLRNLMVPAPYCSVIGPSVNIPLR